MAELLTAARARELVNAWDRDNMAHALRAHADALDAGAVHPAPSAVAWLAKYVGATTSTYPADITSGGTLIVVARDGVVREVMRSGQHVIYDVALHGLPVLYRISVLEGKAS